MTLTERLSDSELFQKLVKRKSLKHPTSSAFAASDWTRAAEALDSPNARDAQLLRAAVHFGQEIAALRGHINEYLVQPFSRASGLRTLAATSNQQFVALKLTSERATKREVRNSETAHYEFVGNSVIRASTGQEMTADELVTQLVDALPHWLHHIWKIPKGTSPQSTVDPFTLGFRAVTAASIERSLRDLWHTVVWEGRELAERDGGLVIRPTDYVRAEQWFVWHLRDYSNMSFEAMIDGAASNVTKGRSPPVVPVIERTVIRIERNRGRKRRFVVGRANGLSLPQRRHVSERDMLERLYTGIFLNEPLPDSRSLQLTCRELCNAWWVLADLAELLLAEIGEHRLVGDDGANKAAFTVKLAELVGIITKSLAISDSRARSIIDYFVCNPSDTTRLFSKSLWSKPLLPASRERFHIVVAPLLVGSPIRRIEAWLELGGATDRGRVKSRGRLFEAHVRSELAAALKNNELIADATILNQGLKQIGNSEEIDLLIRIGNTVLVGEIKCLIAPVEPMDRFNYLNTIDSAAEQARRKYEWAKENKLDVLMKVGVSCNERIKSIILHPIVVINQGFGFGLDIDGVLVTDLHYLSILLACGEYQSGIRFETGNVTGTVTRLYKSQHELESLLSSLLRRPPPLNRYKGRIGWNKAPFPTSTDGPLVIETPRLEDAPVDQVIHSLFGSRPGA